MIVDLLHWEGYILAVNTTGQLIVWNLTPNKHHSTYRFDHNISLMPSYTSKSITKNELLGLVTLENAIVAYNRTSLLVFELPTMREGLQESMFETMTQIKLLYELEQNEKISSLVAVDSESVVFGTNFSKLYNYNIRERKVNAQKTVNIQKSQDVGLFATGSPKSSEITALAVLKGKDLLVVGCENGKILVVHAQRLEVVNQITQNSKNPLEKVNKLYLPSVEEKLYSVHQNYVLEWNYKLNSLHCCYQFNHPTGVVFNDQTLYLGGNSNSLARIKDQVGQTKLSVRCVGVMRELESNLFGVGGTDNMIDVFQDGMRLMTLFKK